jgi:hypothetical protein
MDPAGLDAVLPTGRDSLEADASLFDSEDEPSSLDLLLDFLNSSRGKSAIPMAMLLMSPTREQVTAEMGSHG